MAVRDVVQAAAGALGGEATYVEDVFSTYLYTGNGSTQTITNGIDLDGEGGLVWIKQRDVSNNHSLFDSIRGATVGLHSNTAGANQTSAVSLTSFNSNGFSLGSGDAPGIEVNTNLKLHASWTFRKAPKFFDVVTYTGNGTAGRTVAHNLGSVPGCIIVKSTNASGFWRVYHRSIGNTGGLSLSQSTSTATTATYWNNTSPTDTEFTLGDATAVNGNGGSFVAYLFAHNDGGFGDDGTENVISCGSYTGNSSSLPNTISLGFEPQWVMVKKSNGSSDWAIWDTMRGMTLSSNAEALEPNTSDAESTTGNIIVYPTADGFEFNDASDFANFNGGTYIYIAIRRGPMKTPEAGTEVFALDTQTAGAPNYTSGFVTDASLRMYKLGSSSYPMMSSRLTAGYFLKTSSTGSETSLSSWQWDFMDGYGDNMGGTTTDAVSPMFRRAPGFFDVVAYTGNGTAGRTVSHNLGVAPEMIMVKSRSASYPWYVGHSGFDANGDGLPWTDVTDISSGAPFDQNRAWNDTAPTDSVFTVGDATSVNLSGGNYIAYLFATLPGVSKVGSYTGTAANLDVDCGFSAGARFVLIKRTDSTGDWYVWDSLRGITAGNDPYLLLNSAAAEVTSTDYIDPLSSGFTVTSAAPAALNASGGSYIFLAIA